MSKLLWATFLPAPVAVAGRFLGFPPVVEFAVAAAALVPLAWLISTATEQAGHRTGPALGALLNATFGNATELILSFFAISAGLFEVVRGSLSGSVVSNILLVLGLAMLLGGEGELDRKSVLPSLGLVGAAGALFVLPAAAHWSGVDRETAVAGRIVPVAAALIAIYAVYSFFDIRRQARLAKESSSSQSEEAWPLRRSLTLLALGAAATGFVSEAMTSSIEEFSETIGLTLFFVSIVLVALIGNAAEHGTSIIVAAKGNLALGTEVALRSGAQVAALLIPAIALLSWFIKPLPLAFHPVEIAGFGVATGLTTAVVVQGRSSRARGAVLVAGYAAAVAAFFATHGLP